MENKNKKTRLSKKLIAVVAIVLMMGLIVGMGAMTYSKYVTSQDTGSQTATAAKWGFVVNADASKLFGTDYTTAGIVEKGNGVSVKASTDANANVVAPGTSGSMTVTVSGSAEVLAKVTLAGTVTSEINFAGYYPVKWSLQKDTADATTYDTLKELIAAFNSTEEIDAGNTFNHTYTISWEWVLEDKTDSYRNVKDTLIGYKAYGKPYDELPSNFAGVKYAEDKTLSQDSYDDIVSTMEFNLTVTVEQIQTKSN